MHVIIVTLSFVLAIEYRDEYIRDRYAIITFSIDDVFLPAKMSHELYFVGLL